LIYRCPGIEDRAYPKVEIQTMVWGCEKGMTKSKGEGTLTGQFRCGGSSRAVCVESFWALDVEVKDLGCAMWNFFVGWKVGGFLIAEMRLC
jgi:hypothetical protein